MDLTGYDGLRLRVKGDGNRYKLNLKTTDAAYQAPECVYQVREGGGGLMTCVYI